MSIVGGLCFLLIGLLNRRYEYEMTLTSQMFISGAMITFVEFLAGVILNLWLKLDIWDYSEQKYNILGQICMAYFGFWQFLSLVGIFLNDYFRWFVFGEEKPHYYWFWCGGKTK